MPPDLVGTTIAERFEVLAFAGAGGMGHVYRARDARTGTVVAVKVLAPLGGDAARFAREAAILAKLDHPGIVRYVDSGALEDGAQYLAMDWLEGEDLGERLAAEGTLSVEDTMTIAQKMAEALAAAHRAGVIHRDLKPANVFLVGGHIDAPKLLDFGVARTTTSSDLTTTGAMVGTPAYAAPEQVRGDAIGPACDVYGIGALIFRCLTGRAPFTGAHQLAVLAKVIVEPAPLLRDLRGDVPQAISDLVARLLAKDPTERPADGEALGAELTRPTEPKVRAAISSREQRIACVVLCATGPTPHEVTMVEGTVPDIQATIHTRGGVIARIGDGASVITIPHAVSAAEQAERAARCALALAALRPGSPLFVATGRVIVTGEGRVGEVIDRAAAALVKAKSEGLEGAYLDPATAELVSSRFRIDGQGEWRRLLEEDESASPVRTLLGRPAQCIGREAQLAMLGALLAACVDDARAGVALVVADAGVGKSRLVSELLRRRPQGMEVVTAKGDPMRAGSPFGMVAQLLGKNPVSEVLREIAGTPVSAEAASPALRAARADATVLADALREAFAAWLAERPALLVLLEDVHWADAASLRLLDAALDTDRSVFVLATGRPDGSTPFTERFKPRGLTEITLGPLGNAAAEKLVRSALGNVDPDVLKELCRRAAGHPFFLEELVRAVAEGRGADALPDSVLGMMQTRLDGLGGAARQVLRAGSVFGEAWSKDGVLALLGEQMTGHETQRAIAELTAQEMIADERGKYRFRHMLLRDAAYATLADVDRIRAHRRAAEWLETSELDPAVLAEHYARGDVSDRACEFFRRAAVQAIARNDFDRAHAHAQRALAFGPDVPTEAALRGIEAEVLYWRGDILTAVDRAPSAVARLVRGSQPWLDAVSVAVGALGQLGRNDEVTALLQDAAGVTTTPESRGPHVVALCRGMTQLFWAHARADLASVRRRLDSLVEEPLDAYPAGWVHRVRAESAWLHERAIPKCLAELDASIAAFDTARATRPLCLSRLNAASLVGWSGDAERGLELVRLAMADAERIGAGFLLRYGKAVEGLVRAFARDPDAEATMTKALQGVAGSPRLAFICHVVAGSLALDRGEVTEHVEAATRIDVVDDLRSAGLALASRAALGRGDVADATRLAESSVRMASRCTDLELTFGMPELALAEATGSTAPLDEVARQIYAMAETLPEAQRARFLARPLANDRIVKLYSKRAT